MLLGLVLSDILAIVFQMWDSCLTCLSAKDFSFLSREVLLGWVELAKKTVMRVAIPNPRLTVLAVLS